MENNKREWPPVRRPRRRGVNIRPIALALALVLLVGAAVGGTIAWLTDTTGNVKNTFTASNIEITLTEDAADFKMVPGCDIDKDPKVTVDDAKTDVDIYLFVKAEKSANYSNYLEEYVIADGWTKLTGVDGVYYREVKTTDSDKEFDVLKDNKVTVLDAVTKAQMEEIDGIVVAGQSATEEQELDARPTLTFTAYAVQKAGSANAAEAWAKLTP